MADTSVVLDRYNCDLNIRFPGSQFSASTLNQPEGFRIMWGGVRATHGVCRGKVYFEVKVTDHLDSRVGAGFSEPHPNVMRVGWSVDGPSFALGESAWSFGYGGVGKVCNNNTYTDYGQEFGLDDVIGAKLNLDVNPPEFSFTKNGRDLGLAGKVLNYQVGRRDMALFPHVYCKNAAFKVNFGQEPSWSKLPTGFKFISQMPVGERINGLKAPSKKSNCEMIMLVGLPGCGKTTWAMNKQATFPEKRYNILGTDLIIDRMRVAGMARYSRFEERFATLIKMASDCLNTLLPIAASLNRNYILDQTNVYPSARKQKMRYFSGFIRVAVVILPELSEHERRMCQRTRENGKAVPADAVRKMKANFILPEEKDRDFDRIEYAELDKDRAQRLVIRYNREGI
ncbi:heterogeneous nuclear ribonucleoprotein U-like protein 1 [Physella acuta]|uniref:heterogeneous nuclear ribonucleoprotein U-like protein 1 n=1 Tax=Physella acuta TaxID=109671 RepID=UPI0027DE831A|nr:heterogeneous nuclear ribonucleoprotein U-like protein 1 [Physella acuta]